MFVSFCLGFIVNRVKGVHVGVLCTVSKIQYDILYLLLSDIVANNGNILHTGGDGYK